MLRAVQSVRAHSCQGAEVAKESQKEGLRTKEGHQAGHQQRWFAMKLLVHAQAQLNMLKPSTLTYTLIIIVSS